MSHLTLNEPSESSNERLEKLIPPEESSLQEERTAKKAASITLRDVTLVFIGV
jgi:hypothetical protein